MDAHTSQMNCLKQVKNQYEDYPYPPRNPEDEKKRLIVANSSYLAKINHYCFKGKEDFNNSFRVLEAGGGTGDTTIMLSESLRGKDAEVVYLDISSASMEIARQRAKIRKLDNIKWVNGSILDIDELGLGKFDYINCKGVLHHLENPDDGLKALKNSLKEDGAVGIMVYGQHARTGIYQMQEMLRMVNANHTDIEMMLQNTKLMYDSLPATNIFKKMESHFGFPSNRNNDPELYDLFLHSQDRAYTVEQIYQWVDDCGLNFIDFAEKKTLYRPELFIKDPDLLNTINNLPVKKQQAIAELMSCMVKMHFFFASAKTDTIADPRDIDNVPFVYRKCPFVNMYDSIKDLPLGATINLEDKIEGIAQFVIGRYTKDILRHFNGTNSIGEIFRLVKMGLGNGSEPADEELMNDFIGIYKPLELLGFAVLRNKSVPVFLTSDRMQQRVIEMYG